MHTTPDTDINTIETSELLAVRTQIELERLRLELTMIRVQTKALETLERLMDDPEPTGNEKQDRFEATKRNRQRLAANQVLIHCRTAEREKRLAKTNRQQKGLEPNRASDGQQAPENEVPTPPSPLEAEGGRASDRMRGRPEPSDHQSPPSLGAMAHAENKTEGAGHADNGSPVEPLPPSPLAGEGGRASGRMRGCPEPSNHPNNGTTLTPSHKLRPITERTLTTPPKPTPPKKFIKPKHPRRSRKRKRGR